MDSIDLNEIFLDENYSISSLLTKTNDLQKLRDSLVEHKQNLNQNLLELFNNSYDKFYKLSYTITHISEPIQHLIEPTQNFRNSLGELCNVHDSYIGEINTKIAALEDANKNKELAKKLVGLIKRMHRIESQINNIDWSIQKPSRHIGYEIKCDLMERLYIELFHLSCEVCAIQPTQDVIKTIKKSLEDRLERHRSQLDNWFYDAFLCAIDSRDEVMMGLVLRTYEQIGSTSRLERVAQSRNEVKQSPEEGPKIEVQVPDRASESAHQVPDSFLSRGGFIFARLRDLIK